MPTELKEICANCGFTKGSHIATGYYSGFYGKYIHINYCPEHEGRMDLDLDKGPGTTFAPTGTYKENKE